MTQRRTGLFWALFAAILAMLLCSVGAAEGEERKLVFDDLPDTVNLYTGDQTDAHGYLNIFANTDDYSAIDKVDFDFICKDPKNEVLSNIWKSFDSDDSNKHWIMNVHYTPAHIGKCIYTVTASIPGTDYKVSKDITFIVHDSSSSLPSIEINRNYFDENNKYNSELLLPNDGSPLRIKLPEEAIPSYTIDGTKIHLKSYSLNCDNQRTGEWELYFTKAGNYIIRFSNLADGSNVDLDAYLTFIVKSNIAVDNPTPVITDVPASEVSIGNEITWLGINVLNCERKVEWNAVCDNPNIVLTTYTANYDSSTIRIGLFSNANSAVGTVTITAWYSGYEDKAAVAQFKVYSGSAVATAEPTAEPTAKPTAEPTAEPTAAPTDAPTDAPVFVPTAAPIVVPTPEPEVTQTAAPTAVPTPAPTPTPIKQVTTGGKNLNVRTSPVSGEVIGKLPNGTKLEVLFTENGWSKVRATLPDGNTIEGFVSDVYLADVKPTATPSATATAQPGANTPAPTAAPAHSAARVATGGTALRLRSGPSANSDILVRMPNDAQITAYETQDGWTRIKFIASDGKEYQGWASSKYIKADTKPTAAHQPTATPAPNSKAQVSAGGKRLNMRAQPGTDSEVVVKLSADADIVVLEYGEEWSLCSYNGVTGYCATAYLKFN